MKSLQEVSKDTFLPFPEDIRALWVDEEEISDDEATHLCQVEMAKHQAPTNNSNLESHKLNVSEHSCLQYIMPVEYVCKVHSANIVCGL